MRRSPFGGSGSTSSPSLTVVDCVGQRALMKDHARDRKPSEFAADLRDVPGPRNRKPALSPAQGKSRVIAMASAISDRILTYLISTEPGHHAALPLNS